MNVSHQSQSDSQAETEAELGAFLQKVRRSLMSDSVNSQENSNNNKAAISNILPINRKSSLVAIFKIRKHFLRFGTITKAFRM